MLKFIQGGGEWKQMYKEFSYLCKYLEKVICIQAMSPEETELIALDTDKCIRKPESILQDLKKGNKKQTRRYLGLSVDLYD